MVSRDAQIEPGTLSRDVHIGVIQMGASADQEENLKKIELFATEAKKAGAELVVAPEMAYLIAKGAISRKSTKDYQKLVERFSDLARRLQIDLMPGSLREPVPNEPENYFNTSVYFDKSGKLIAQYRKLFLFKAQLDDRNYDEGKYCRPGKTFATADRDFGKVGLSICYDLRFPEVFRALRKKGAAVILVPAAFTPSTGQAHWETLLKARAIENQVWIVAPALVGKCGDGRFTYGHSLVVSPWGDVILDMKELEGAKTVVITAKAITDYRKKIDVWASYREDLSLTPESYVKV